MEKIKVENQACFGIWLIGWLFTIGYVHLSFGQGLLAIVIWPYYLGDALRALM